MNIFDIKIPVRTKRRYFSEEGLIPNQVYKIYLIKYRCSECDNPWIEGQKVQYVLDNEHNSVLLNQHYDNSFIYGCDMRAYEIILEDCIEI